LEILEQFADIIVKRTKIKVVYCVVI